MFSWGKYICTDKSIDTSSMYDLYDTQSFIRCFSIVRDQKYGNIIVCTLFLSTLQLNDRQLRYWNITFYCMLGWRNCIGFKPYCCQSLCNRRGSVSALFIPFYFLGGQVGSKYRSRNTLYNLITIVHTLICVGSGWKYLLFPYDKQVVNLIIREEHLLKSKSKQIKKWC